MKGKSNILIYQNNNIIRKIQARTARACLSERLGADHLTLEGEGVGDFGKKFPASAYRKKKIASSTNVIESLREKKGKKYPAHQIARKKILDDQKSSTPTFKS